MAEDTVKEKLEKKIFVDVEPEEPKPEPASAPEAQDEARGGVAVEEAPEAAAGAPAEEAPKDPRIRWYVIHTYSGYENKVKSNLERRTQSMRSQGGEKIAQVLVPTEKEKEIKGGKRREVDRKIYPGYVLVEMIMDDDSWYVVRNT